MTNQQTQAPRRVRPRPRMVTVKTANHITPGCVRVVFTGPELEGFERSGPADHIKVMFPTPGRSNVVLPEWGPEGPILAEGQSMPASRTYTPRFWSPEALELTVDFMLHESGLASDWARATKPGDVLAVSGRAGGPWNIDPEADWYLLAADEAALPGLGTILDDLPAGKRARVFVEVMDEHEQQPLQSPADVEVTWLYHGEAQPGPALDAAIHNVEIPEGDGRVWVGCEAGAMRSIRRHLLEDRGFDRSRIHTHGYWKLGAANHPDHDVGQDA